MKKKESDMSVPELKSQNSMPENAQSTPQINVGWVAYTRRRIMAGLFAALPLFITAWILGFIYNLIIYSVLNPLRNLILGVFGLTPNKDSPWWWQMAVAPGLVMILLGLVLFLLGGLAQSRIYRSIDWLFRNVPIVKTVYDAVSGFIKSLSQSGSSASKFEKVVLFNFPNSRVKSLGFVTGTLVDKQTGNSIYAVMLLTGVMPPTGFTLFVPVEDVIEIDWTPTQAIQAIVSGGISIPDQLRFE
jgi:uncharacterized membrane protein